MDQELFKAGLSRWGSGVTVITTLDENNEPVGFTATSFSSLSLDPPLVLFCLSLYAQSIQGFRNSQEFAVNILRSDQEELSNLFASGKTDKFKDLALGNSDNGAPWLEGCLANITCRKHSVFDGGDHLIFVGEVLNIALGEGDPLLYFQGKYRSLTGSG